ncbi:DNA-deoxyinosine glycosylase [Comamonas jiangduensis]|jgi:TDG/mug DNA glycosylase family protein|uniref:DNA-deoxyinosine glycosylase n=1 Tax=Comamonas jiangduensis TaxID=1194168 RepID=UPI003BF79C10
MTVALDSALLRLQGLPPVADARTRLLILGSFPGVASLQAQQYYAHPHNKLWPILAALWPQLPQPDRADYAARCEWLLQRGLGLWDVYDSCERQGSLDSAIRIPQVNDFAALKQRCPQLQAVAHNGAESFKHAGKLAGLGLVVYKLPSTSPANAGWSWERKLTAWREVMQAAGLVHTGIQTEKE